MCNKARRGLGSGASELCQVASKAAVEDELLLGIRLGELEK